VIDHRAQRRGLARPGRTRDEHEPLVQRAEVQDVLREPELFGGEDLRRDDAQHPRNAAAILEGVDAEARQAR